MALTIDQRHFRRSRTAAAAAAPIDHHRCFFSGAATSQKEVISAFLLPFARSPRETCLDSTCSRHSIVALAGLLEVVLGKDRS